MGQVEPYDRDFARLYDLLVYCREEVEAGDVELGFLRWAFCEACGREVGEILDVGCGTGRHVLPLAREGYTVTGLDSSQAMLDECSRRLKKHGLRARLVHTPMEQLQFENAFDVLLCMNATLCYVLETESLLEVLRGFRRALRPGGLMVLDNWNFFAQWHRFGKTCSDVRGTESVRIQYQDQHWYDDFASIYHIDMVANVREGDRRYTIRRHDALRAMTVSETKLCLEKAGFAQVSAYPSFDRSQAGDRMIFLAIRREA